MDYIDKLNNKERYTVDTKEINANLHFRTTCAKTSM